MALNADGNIILELFESKMNEIITSAYYDVLLEVNKSCTKILKEGFKEKVKYEIMELRHHLDSQMQETEVQINNSCMKVEKSPEFESINIVVSPSGSMFAELPNEDTSFHDTVGEKENQRIHDSDILAHSFGKREKSGSKTKNEMSGFSERRGRFSQISDKYNQYIEIKGRTINKRGKLVSYGRCAICKKRYETRDSIRRHIRKEHAEILETPCERNVYSCIAIDGSPIISMNTEHPNEDTPMSLSIREKKEEIINMEVKPMSGRVQMESVFGNLTPKEISERINPYVEIQRRTKNKRGKHEIFGRCGICKEKQGRVDIIRRHIKLVHHHVFQTPGIMNIDSVKASLQDKTLQSNSSIETTHKMENVLADPLAKYIGKTGYTYHTARCKICSRSGTISNIRHHIKRAHKVNDDLPAISKDYHSLVRNHHAEGNDNRPTGRDVSIYTPFVERLHKTVPVRSKDKFVNKQVSRCKICHYESYSNISRHMRIHHPSLFKKQSSDHNI